MRVQLEKRGVLGAGQVKKGGSLPRHIPILNIYVSTPPRDASPSLLGPIKTERQVNIQVHNMHYVHINLHSCTCTTSCIPAAE